MNTSKEKYEILIIKEQDGLATTEELSLLHAWIEASDINKRFYEETRKLWEIKPVDPSSVVIDHSKAWEKIQQQIEFEEQKKGETIQIPFHRRFRTLYAMTGLAAMFLIFIGIYLFTMSSNDLALIAYEHTADEITADPVTLPDGSLVFFNGPARIEFPESFAPSKRQVLLTGDAFFEVKTDPQAVFEIQWNGTIVRVLGTSFSVQHLKENGLLQLAVVSGKVLFIASSGKEVLLEEGKMAVLDNKSQEFEKRTIEDFNFLAWHTQRLEFKDDSLDKVFRDLEKTYRIHIRWAENLSEYRLTARFVNENPEDIFNTLSMLFDLTVKQEDGVYFVSK